MAERAVGTIWQPGGLKYKIGKKMTFYFAGWPPDPGNVAIQAAFGLGGDGGGIHQISIDAGQRLHHHPGVVCPCQHTHRN